MTKSSRAVFLSYASEDAAAAQSICSALRAAGVEVWFDQSELRGGDAWDRQIKKQIHDCALFIAVVSAHSNARDEGYFRREWRLAVERTHDMADDTPFLLPVTVDETVEANARVPDQFRDVQWTRLPAGETPPSFVDRVVHLLSPHQAAEPKGASSGLGKALGSASAPRERVVSREPPHWTKLIVLPVAALALVGGGYLVVSKFTQSKRVAMAQRTNPRAPSALAAPVAVAEKSIAVLPFVDMSEKKDQEYFSDGLTEELIDHLAHAAELKVVARTSSFQFKGKSEDVRSIAGKLGVAHVLEGSVRKSGNTLRITAQLIRAADGTHLWSETYDRSLKDIFKVQDDIAATVAGALKVVLGSTNGSKARAESNTESYNFVLKGNYYFARGNSGDNFKAIEQYQQALRLDPKYALAWAKLARTYAWQPSAGEVPSAEGASKARAAARRALALDPNSAQAHYALGNVFRFVDYDWAAAKSEYEKVIALDPNGENNIDARENILLMAAAKSGRMDDLLSMVREMVVQNPLDTSYMSDLAWFQQYAGQLETSADTSRRILELNPAYSTAQAQYAQTLLLMGKYADALSAAERESDEPSKLAALSCIYWSMGDRASSDAAIHKLEAEYSRTSAYLVALGYAWRGEADAAFAWLERAWRQRDGLIGFVKIDPLLRRVHGDSRFNELLVKMKFAD